MNVITLLLKDSFENNVTYIFCDIYEIIDNSKDKMKYRYLLQSVYVFGAQKLCNV